MREKIEALIIKANKPGKKTFFLKCWCLLTGVLSLFYALGVILRNALYDRGLLKQVKCRLPVVSIGNLVSGGSGKTPLTLKLVKELLPYGKVAILSRGYKGEVEKGKVPLLVSRGQGALFPPQVCGDEVYLLAEALPGAIVVAGKDRVKAAEMAFEAGAKLIVLDDGLQHRRLFREDEIILVSGKDPFSGGHFLPRGFLRDEPRRINKATLLVVNGKEEDRSLKKMTSSPRMRVENVTEKVTSQKGEKVILNEKKSRNFLRNCKSDKVFRKYFGFKCNRCGHLLFQ